MKTKLYGPKTQKFDATNATTQLLLDNQYIEALNQLSKEAKQRIWILAYTWRWYENHPEREIQKFNAMMARRASIGLDIRVICHSKQQADSLRAYGMRTKILPTLRVMHTKAVLIDDDYLLLGSHNLTERGTDDNFEASLLTKSSGCIVDFIEYFQRMWDNYAE